MKNCFYFLFVSFLFSLVTARANLNRFKEVRSIQENEQDFSMLVKRQNSQGDNPPDNLLDFAYLTFADDLIKAIRAAKTSEEQAKILNGALQEDGNRWIESCKEIANASAKSAHRTDTVPRIVFLPQDDPKTDIDPEYQLALTVKVACWERAAKGDKDKPIVNYTSDLVKKFKWDKESALHVLEEQHKKFKPIQSGSTKQ